MFSQNVKFVNGRGFGRFFLLHSLHDGRQKRLYISVILLTFGSR